jgi:hypothetical protein
MKTFLLAFLALARLEWRDAPNDVRGSFGLAPFYNSPLHACIDVMTGFPDGAPGTTFMPPFQLAAPVDTDFSLRALIQCAHSGAPGVGASFSCSSIGVVTAVSFADVSGNDRGQCVRMSVGASGNQGELVVCAFRTNTAVVSGNGVFNLFFREFMYSNVAEFNPLLAAQRPQDTYCHVEACVVPHGFVNIQACQLSAPADVRTWALRLNNGYYRDRTGPAAVTNLLDGAQYATPKEGCHPVPNFVSPLNPAYLTATDPYGAWYANGIKTQASGGGASLVDGFAYVALGTVNLVPPARYRSNCLCTDQVRWLDVVELGSMLIACPATPFVSAPDLTLTPPWCRSCRNCRYPYFGLNCQHNIETYTNQQCHWNGLKFCGSDPFSGACMGANAGATGPMSMDALDSTDRRRTSIFRYDQVVPVGGFLPPPVPPDVLTPNAALNTVVWFCECSPGYFGGNCDKSCGTSCSAAMDVSCQDTNINAPVSVAGRNVYVPPLTEPQCVCARGYFPDSALGASAPIIEGGDPIAACWTCHDFSGLDVPLCGGRGVCVQSASQPFSRRPACSCLDGSLSTTGCRIKSSYTYSCGPQLQRIVCEPDALLVGAFLLNPAVLLTPSWVCRSGLVVLPDYVLDTVSASAGGGPGGQGDPVGGSDNATVMTTEFELRFVKLLATAPIVLPEEELVFSDVLDNVTWCRVFLQSVLRTRQDPRAPTPGTDRNLASQDSPPGHIFEQISVALELDAVRVSMWHNGVLVLGDPERRGDTDAGDAGNIGGSGGPGDEVDVGVGEAQRRLDQAALHDALVASSLGLPAGNPAGNLSALYPDARPRSYAAREWGQLGPCPAPFSREMYNPDALTGPDALSDVCPMPSAGPAMGPADPSSSIWMLSASLGSPRARVDCFWLADSAYSIDALGPNGAAVPSGPVDPLSVAREFRCLPSPAARPYMMLDCVIAVDSAAVRKLRLDPWALLVVIGQQCACPVPQGVAVLGSGSESGSGSGSGSSSTAQLAVTPDSALDLCVSDDACVVFGASAGCVPHASCYATTNASSGAVLLRCECDLGWAGDGTVLCTDMDECALNPLLCSVGSTDPEICINTAGSFICTAVCTPAQDTCPNFAYCLRAAGTEIVVCQCAPGFTKSLDELSCEHPGIPPATASQAGQRFHIIEITDSLLSPTASGYAFYDLFVQQDIALRAASVPSSYPAQLQFLLDAGYVTLVTPLKKWGSFVGVWPQTPSLTVHSRNVIGSSGLSDSIPVYAPRNQMALFAFDLVAASINFPPYSSVSSTAQLVWTGLVHGSPLSPALYAVGSPTVTLGQAAAPTRDLAYNTQSATVATAPPRAIYAISPLFEVAAFP